MRHKCVAILWKGMKIHSVHKFDIEVEGKSRYRALISLEYFRSREGSKLVNKQPFLWRTHCMDLSDWETHQAVDQRMSERHGIELPVYETFEHASIWEMYEAIGYDYKKQRYVRD